ncbi:MAG TPA: amino acid adenylation domain-containing protein, partial [Longimicrobium sp.]|nr:amino acid adenylation domain-containing protein [Longimicrobium sp.]
LDRNPLVQVAFALQGVDRSAVSLPGLLSRGVELETGTTKFDLFLELTPAEGGLRGELEYATDLFDADTIRRMAGHWVRLLEQAAEEPSRCISELELLGAAERRMLLEEWNQTDEAYPAGRCIHQLVEAQVARTPDAEALIFDRQSLTYRELNERANRIAHHLLRLGVRPDSRVGICLRRGPELIAAMLGVLKAGAAYAPLDPAYPVDRLRFILDDADAVVLLTQDALRDLLPVPDGVPVVCLDTAADVLGRESPDDPGIAVDPRGLAYLIYTSGSTGRPKGVAIEHRSAVVFLSWAAGVFTADELSGVLAGTSICFDISIFEIFLPLSRGGRVIVAENALAVTSIPAADQVRLLNTVPSAGVALLANDGIPPGVITVNLAGETLRAEVVDAVYARGIQRVHDFYGPSEDTTYSTWSLRRAGGIETIGRPISNTQAYVLDAALRLVPVGIPGELYLGGLGLARGYLGHPGMTAERFIPDPFSGDPGARIYRTGDRIRWLPDGNLSYLGRLDGQVKVRGFRIELGEVETALRRVPGVTACTAIVREDSPGERRLVAYVLGDADAEAMRATLRGTLPEYMVPSAFVVLDAIPLTPNGKVDRKALPAPEPVLDDHRYVAPRTPVEAVLAGILAEVLERERVGARDNFFEIGGHSLLATRLLSRVRAAFGPELPLRALFEAPTAAALAERVEAARRSNVPQAPPLEPVERTGPLPLSFSQERLWFLHRLQPDSAFYNVPAVVRLSGALNVAALERALSEIVRRHEVLRTTFHEHDDEPVQVVAPFAGFTLPVEDLSALPEREREAFAERRAADEAARPFSLSTGPLFRPTLLRLDDGEHVLLLCMHHIVCDEWSIEVLYSDLATLYAAHAAGVEPRLPALPVQYADYATWQRRHLHGDTLERRLAWWKERMAGAPAVLELPTDRPRPAVQSFRGASVHAELPRGLRERLEALARGEGATLYMVLLAAFQVLLGRYAGTDDVVVGSPVAGQTRREVEDLLGFFTHTLVLRADLSGDPGFRQLLRRVRDSVLGAYEHREVPFERLVEALQPERSLAHSPLFQAMFVMADAAPARVELPGVHLRRDYAESHTSKFDLVLSAAPHADGLRATAEYATDLFEGATVQRMLGHLRRVLEQVAEDGALRLSRLELVGDDERRAVVSGWNRTAAEYPAGVHAHHAFEARAAAAPGAAAVVWEDGTLSYGELNDRANRLAHHLAALGVGPEAR